MIITGFLVAGLVLFLLLDSKRRALTAPATQAGGVDAYGRAAAPPPTLFIPPIAAPEPVAIPAARPTPAPLPPRTDYPVSPPPRYEPPPIQMSSPIAAAPTAPTPVRSAVGQAIVYDATQADAPSPTAPGAGGGASASVLGDRARASILRNGATTVPQGTLIPAVLETALDSTRPGLARALVQRDVVGFDGSQVLIQRGSRLIGEYRAELQPGQNRASVLWTRLVRPDGVTIALGSQAADTLGRGGIKGNVNSHFLARFGAAILQSTLDVGVALASRAGNNNGVIIGAPLGAAGGGNLIGGGNQVRPTLTVKQGTTLMVFVARDLDFSGVGVRP